jgi:hypothetical protein
MPSSCSRCCPNFDGHAALAYLLLKIGWSGYEPTEGIRNLLSGLAAGWQEYDTVLRSELL